MSKIHIEAGSNLMVIEGAVNKPTLIGQFIIDTGSTDCILTKEAAKVYGYKPRNAPVEVQGLNKLYQGEPVLLDSLTVSGITVKNVAARIVDELPISPKLSGIIGMSFLGQVNFSVIGDQLMVSKR